MYIFVSVHNHLSQFPSPPPTFYQGTPQLYLNYTSVFIKQDSEFIAGLTIDKLALRSLGPDLMKFTYTGINKQKNSIPASISAFKSLHSNPTHNIFVNHYANFKH